MKRRDLRSSRGGALLLVVVLFAVVLTGALVAGALALRELNQQRTLETRRRLETAFQGIFAYPQPRRANMWKDFGYAPDPARALTLGGYATKGWFLQGLVDRLRVGDSDPAHNPPPAFAGLPGGWNGPYWQGSTDAQSRPLDAWGRPIQLRYVTSPSAGWQVYSLGANGLDNTDANAGTPGGDDLAYPMPPFVVPPTSTDYQVGSFTLHVNVSDLGPGNNHVITVYVTGADGVERALSPAGVQMHSKGNGGKPITWDWNTPVTVRYPPGTIRVRIVDSGTAVLDNTYPIPRQSSYTLNIAF